MKVSSVQLEAGIRKGLGQNSAIPSTLAILAEVFLPAQQAVQQLLN
jgi:hypothetical protein